jgi:hypothetical protein
MGGTALLELAVRSFKTTTLPQFTAVNSRDPLRLGGSRPALNISVATQLRKQVTELKREDGKKGSEVIGRPDLNICWNWLSRDDERDPREFSEYVAFFEDEYTSAPSAAEFKGSRTRILARRSTPLSLKRRDDPARLG